MNPFARHGFSKSIGTLYRLHFRGNDRLMDSYFKIRFFILTCLIPRIGRQTKASLKPTMGSQIPLKIICTKSDFFYPQFKGAIFALKPCSLIWQAQCIVFWMVPLCNIFFVGRFIRNYNVL